MSWKNAKEHMDTYRKGRKRALNNGERQKWFTTPLTDVAELFTVIFDRDTENNKWDLEYSDPDGQDVEKLANWRIRIATMASSARDLRSQFSAWKSHRVRVPLDWDRFELQRVLFNRMRLDHLDQIVEDKKAGIEPMT